MVRSNEDRNSPEIPIDVPSEPFSPWLRFAVIHSIHEVRDGLGVGDGLSKSDGIVTHTWARPGVYVGYIDDFELHLQLEGKSWVSLEAIGGSIDVGPGDLIFFPPNLVHTWHYCNECHIAVHFDLHARPSMQGPAVHRMEKRVYRRPTRQIPVFVLRSNDSASDHNLRIPMVTHVTEFQLWRERLEALVRLYESHENYTFQERFKISETISWALSALHISSAVGGTDSRIDPSMDSVIREMKDPRTRMMLKTLTMKQIASRTERGVTAFRESFKNATGETPHGYLLRQDIEYAAHLLLVTEGKIKEIAEQLGYRDQYCFSQVFHRIMGSSPSDYRKRSRVVGSEGKNQPKG